MDSKTSVPWDSPGVNRRFHLISTHSAWLPSVVLLFTVLISSSVANENVVTTSKCDVTQDTGFSVNVKCSGYVTIPSDISAQRIDAGKVRDVDMSSGNTLQTLKNGDLLHANLPALKKLMLKSCQIRNIERGAFNGGQGLTELDLSNNVIEVLDPMVFQGLERLGSLILSGNEIHRFEAGASFPPLGSLTKLDFSSCKIDEIPENVFNNLNKLTTLSLRNNSLKTVDWRVFRNKGSFNLDIAENPWHCDCHVKFLIDTLQSASLNYKQVACVTSTGGRIKAGTTWDSVKHEYLTCGPEISKFIYTSHDVINSSHQAHSTDGEPVVTSQANGVVELGHDVYFECEYSGYPEPKVEWRKNGKPIQVSNSNSESSVASGTPRTLSGEETKDNEIDNSNYNHDSPPAISPKTHQPRVSIQTMEFGENEQSEDEKQKNVRFGERLMLRPVVEEDKGKYECFVSNSAGPFRSAVVLNLKLSEGLVIGGGHIGRGGLAIWIWILIGLICVILVCFIVCIIAFVWKKHDKEKQDGFRKVMHEKFKDSNIDIGDLVDMKTTNSNQQKDSYQRANSSEGATPLLDSKNGNGTIVLSMLADQQLPDLTRGNADLVRNSQIFSPKPPPAQNGHSVPIDARKEFFARQISEPYLRPGSAMSLTRPSAVNAAQRRYIFANQDYHSSPAPGQEPQYAVPHQVRMLPRSGSAMSMATLPGDDLRRQLFLRQYSQPSYATAARNRNPSITSEPPQDIYAGSYNYSTLPRRPVRTQNWSRPVSPTNSTCSSYSTLSWRPGMNPATGVFYDGVGPRTTADGGSTLSLNKTPDSNGNDTIDSISRGLVTPSGGGKVMKNGRNPRLGHTRTPNSLTRGHNDFFSFEPIQEVESSECASNANLDSANGQVQTPVGYTTQSLARGEPRYKKKKPPPIAAMSAKLKEPSRAFEHLKGRSVSPAARGNAKPDSNKENNSNTTEVKANDNSSIPTTRGALNNTDSNGNPAVLESTIDDDSSAVNKLPGPPKAPPPPPPPPKPKRTAEESGNLNGNENPDDNDIPPLLPPPPIISDGTVV